MSFSREGPTLMNLVILGLTYLQNLCPLVAKTDQFDGQGDGKGLVPPFNGSNNKITTFSHCSSFQMRDENLVHLNFDLSTLITPKYG